MFLHHLGINPSVFALQLVGTAKLNEPSLFHHHDFVAILKGRKTMSNCQYSAFLELLGDYFLYYCIIFDINVGSCLINQYYFAVLEERSANA